jgi:hypothetical protein
MDNSYRATLKGNTLEWHNQAPENTAKDLEVSVIVLESATQQDQGKRMAQALQALAGEHSLENVDALKWQNKQRQDRVLPNRDK